MSHITPPTDQIKSSSAGMRFRPVTDEDRKQPIEVVELGQLSFMHDRDAAERFLTALDPTQVWHTFQVFDDDYDRKDGDLGLILEGSLKMQWDALCRFQKKGAGAFVTVNVTDGAGRAATNITNVRAVFVDLDGEPLPATFHVKPHIVVESSPGRWRLYWLLKDCPLDRFRSLQQRLIRHYKSDPRIHDLPRVMRLPGFFHQKVKDGIKSMPFRTRLVEAHDHDAYTVDQVTVGLPIEEDPKAKSDGADKQNGTKPWNEVDEARLRSALTAIPADVAALKAKLGDEFDTHLFWINVGRAVHRLGWGERGFAIWRDWSKRCKEEFNEAGLHTNWRSFENTRDSEDKVTVGSVYWYAKEFGWDAPAEEELDHATIKPIDLWGKFDPPELPRGVLPAVFERYATVQAESMGVDPGGLAVGAILIGAAAIPDSIKLQVKRHNRGWLESARLWAALIGMPSTKKTPMIREVSRPLVRIDMENYRAYVLAKKRYDDLDPDERRRELEPVRRQIKLEDTTIEAAQEVLKDNVDGILCLQDELGGWFGSMDKYNSGGGAMKDRGFWLQSWNGGPQSVNRVKRGNYFIDNLSISVLGGIQPDSLRKHIAGTHDDGLIQRVIPVVLREGGVGRDEPMADVVTEYEVLIKRLHELKPRFAAGFDNPGGTADRLVFDDKAQAIRQRLEEEHHKLMRLEAVNKKLAAHVGKYDSFFARLCVVFHCVENAGATSGLPCIITADTAERVAQFLHRYLLPHALAFYAGILDLADDHDDITDLAGFILAHKLEVVTNRDIARGTKVRKLERRETDRLLEQLEALGWLTRRPGPRPSSPPRWEVNPEVHRLYADRAEKEAARRAENREMLLKLGRRGSLD